MNLKDKFILKHELWLKYLFCSFAIEEFEISDKLYEFAKIEFKHLKWLGQKLFEENNELDLNRTMINIAKKTSFEIFEYLIYETELVLKQYDPDDDTQARMLSDEYFFIETLKLFLKNTSNKKIKAFNKNRTYKDKKLDKESLDALTLFLFEESYKEYELIMIYFYMQIKTDNKILANVYQDLIDESQFHLKSFAKMMAEMGILSIPRVVPKEVYEVKDVKKFLLDGIEEEKAAKEECKKLASAVKDEELSKFFDFINFQETYHIKLMQKVIERLD